MPEGAAMPTLYILCFSTKFLVARILLVQETAESRKMGYKSVTVSHRLLHRLVSYLSAVIMTQNVYSIS